MSESASMRLPLHEDDAGRSLSRETVPGGSAQERWVPVRKTVGLLNARIIADSLIAAEIPARAWQDGTGIWFDSRGAGDRLCHGIRIDGRPGT